MRLLTFEMKIPDPLYAELLDACTEANCHRTIFAAEAIESVLASRRFRRGMYVPSLSQGAQLRGTRGHAAGQHEREFEDPTSAGLVAHGLGPLMDHLETTLRERDN